MQIALAFLVAFGMLSSSPFTFDGLNCRFTGMPEPELFRYAYRLTFIKF